MVHNPVPEIGSKYFTFHGFVYYEGDTAAGMVVSAI